MYKKKFFNGRFNKKYIKTGEEVIQAQVTEASNKKYHVYKLKKTDYENEIPHIINEILSKSYLDNTTNHSSIIQNIISECNQKKQISEGFISQSNTNSKYFDFFHNMSYQYGNLLNDYKIPPNMRKTISSVYNWLNKIIYTFSSLHITLIREYYVKFFYYNKIILSDISDVLSKNKMHLKLEYNLFFNPYDFNEKIFLPYSLLD